MSQNTTLSLEEFMQELQFKGGDGTSTYNLRNEQAQEKMRAASIAKLKKELKKKSKLLVAMEIALPFNPMTGVADEIYNADRKFRPQKSATTVALMLKQRANESEQLKKELMKRSGLTSWDTKDINTFTKEDFAVFKPYRVPQIYTFPVVRVDIPAMTGEFGRDYIIKVERDALTGQVKGDMPLALKANQFFREIAYEEYNDFKDKCAKGELNMTEKQQKQYTSDIFGKIPVSDDHPINYVVAVELALDEKYEVVKVDSFKDCTVDQIKGLLVQTRRPNGLKEALEKYTSEAWQKFDKHFDFVEIEMSCPATGDSPAEIGRDTAYEKPTNSLDEVEVYDDIVNAFREYLDTEDELEKTMINSVRIAQYDDRIESQLCAAMSSVVDKDNEFITKSVIEHNQEFITLALGELADEMLLSLVDEDDNRAQGVLNSDEAAAMAKEVNLEEMLNEDLESIDLDSV